MCKPPLKDQLLNDSALLNQVFFNKPLLTLSSMKTGGVAAIYIEPTTEAALLAATSILRANNQNFFLLGDMTNTLISSDAITTPILSTRSLKGITVNKSANHITLTAMAGVSIAAITKVCIKNSLTGFEEFGGLPGSIGGAAAMNARCFGKEISDILIGVRYIKESNIKTLKNITPTPTTTTATSNNSSNNSDDTNKLQAGNLAAQNTVIENYVMDKTDWSYKKSPFGNGCHKIITAVTIGLHSLKDCDTGRDKILSRTKGYVKERRDKGHYRYPSCGSVFKNNHEYGSPSGKIIDNCGLKGLKIGGAEVAPFHGNIIINIGDATSSDICRLTRTIEKTVFEKTGYLLETEILYCTDEDGE